ncbi:MAG: VWA domain-containing protein [Flavobacteriaceae bacterium]
MFELEEKIYFYLLIAIPILLVAFIMLSFWRKKKQDQFANHQLLKRLTPEKSNFKKPFKLVLWSLIIACFSIGLVNPKFGIKLETVKREGVDIVFAVDVSKSMLAEDIAPNRIDKSKQLVTQIINNLASDRIGIIAYAGQAYPQLPITTDYASAKMFLQNMNTNMLSSQGTAISDAIEMATTYFNDEEQTNRILVIISDGEDHSENAISAASLAAEKGIRIFTIGVGKVSGGPIPLKRNGIIESYKKDKNGETVITKLNEAVLSEVATTANGFYLNGSNTQQVVDQIKEELLAMDKKEFETKQYTDFDHQFQWFLGFGLLLLCVDVLVSEKKTKWIKKLNLFNE